MALISTRSYIVFERERMQKYANLLGTTYNAIFEINLITDRYNTLFHTDEPFDIGHSGNGKNFRRLATERVHGRDVKAFLSIFERGSLENVIKNDTYAASDFRCFSTKQDFKWMRVLLIPDEIEKDTILCFITDIDAEKRCELLENENERLAAKVALLSAKLNDAERVRGQVFGRTVRKRQAQGLALR